MVMDYDHLRNRYEHLTRKNRDTIILNPLQTAGRLSPAAKEALVEFGDGYSVCDHCKGKLDEISNPPIKDFVHVDLPEFLDAEIVRITHGAREGKYMVFHGITHPGDTIIVDRNRHYTTNVAAERAGLNVIKVDNSGGTERTVNVEDYIPLIKEHRPKLIFLTYPDGNYGNLPDARRLGEIAQEFGVPYMINAAYSMGRMPLSMKDLHADFLVGSGHKSMASAGPVGVLAMTERWTEKLLQESPQHKGKEIECLGCTVRGVPLMTLMASFPYVTERVQHWDEEVQKARWFSGELETLGLVQLGEKPHKHDLMMFETGPFFRISSLHPKKRAFLYDLLKDNGISGVKHGQTQSMKVSTYGTPKEDLEKVLSLFRGIITEYQGRI